MSGGCSSDSSKATKKKKSKKAKKGKKSSKKKKSSSSAAPSSSEKRVRERQPKKGKLEPLAAESDDDDDLTAEQAVALQEWQLSEVQSLQQDWQEFGKAKAANVPKLSKLVATVPAPVLKSFDLVVKLPFKKLPSNWPKIAERLEYIITTAVSFWEAQQAAAAEAQAKSDT